jgi:hypothetical protein
MWGRLDGVLVAGDRIESGVDCQGIVTFGAPGKVEKEFRRVRVTANFIHLNNAEPNGIALGPCTGCEATYNIIRGSSAYLRKISPLTGWVGCGNVIERRRPNHISEADWGALPCAAPARAQIAARPSS